MQPEGAFCVSGISSGHSKRGKKRPVTYRSTAPVPRGIPPRGAGAEQIVRLWDVVEKNSHVIGDLDILGYRRTISCLREIVFGLCTAPYIAVLRMNRNGQKSPSIPLDVEGQHCRLDLAGI